MVAGADKVELLSLCGPGGGGNYLLRSFEGREVNQGMWLCAVTEYVFGSTHLRATGPPIIGRYGPSYLSICNVKELREQGFACSSRANIHFCPSAPGKLHSPCPLSKPGWSF